ncbi:MAG TPA: trimethylamine methyltransferase family protein, partial [Aggregatilineales bacterium]|nr:trimethylamine methyltransferase family protein [Aggregatilineales bacterium]
QAAYESAMMMQGTILGRVNFVLHAAGWLEGGLAASFEKFVLDCEILGMMQKLMQPVDLSDHALAMDSIRTIEPGGHHLGTEHTMQTMRTAFYQAELFDYGSAEQWEAEGSRDAIQRANAKYKSLLQQYEAPPLDSDVEAALLEFVNRRKQEIKPEY